MSKWRPAEKNCLYVIPDIHGSLDLLQKVCARILPLRKSDGGKDHLVFLGDYIDRHIDSHKVIDFCIELQERYSSQITFLMGNHELMLLQALNKQPNRNLSLQTMHHTYQMWMQNGGLATYLGYWYRKKYPDGKLPEDVEWPDFSRHQLSTLIPPTHLKFLTSLVPYHQFQNYTFVHGGCNPQEPLEKQDLEAMVWDRGLFKFVIKQSISNLKEPLPWDSIVVCGHCAQPDGVPIIKDRYMMLDCGSPSRLLVTELNSKTAFLAEPKKNRLVKFNLRPTTKFSMPNY